MPRWCFLVSLWREHASDGATKKAGTKFGPGIQLVVRPDKFKVKSSRTFARRPAESCPHMNLFAYAVLLGLIVRSRNWVRTLDICIPFNCDTNGRISAMN